MTLDLNNTNKEDDRSERYRINNMYSSPRYLRSSRENQHTTFTNADSTSMDYSTIGRMNRGDSSAIEPGTDVYSTGTLRRDNSGTSTINVGRYSATFRRWGSTNPSSVGVDLRPIVAEIEPPASKLVEEDNTTSDAETEVSSIKNQPSTKDSSSLDRDLIAFRQETLSVNEERSSRMNSILMKENDYKWNKKQVEKQLSSTSSDNNSYKCYLGGSADIDEEVEKEKAKVDLCFEKKYAENSMIKEKNTAEEEKKEALRKRVPMRRDFTQASITEPRAVQPQVDESDWARRNQGRNKVSDLVARFSNPVSVSNATTNYKTEVGIRKVGQIRQNTFY